MANLTLFPQAGTPSDSKSLQFELSDVEVENIRVEVENATEGKMLKVRDFHKYGDRYRGTVDLDISSSNTVFSVFVHIFSSDELIDICSSVFYVTSEKSEFKGSASIEPSFVGPADLCKVNVSSDPNSKVIFSVNDKRFVVRTNDDGEGSIHIKGRDIDDPTAVSRYPLYLYSKDDNYVSRSFSGLYLNVLPESIAVRATTIDPRCDPDDPAYVPPGTWVQPTECQEDPDPGDGDDLDDTISPICIPHSCKAEIDFTDTGVCRINAHSAALLNNGMVVHAYTSVDDAIDTDDPRYNIPRIYYSFNEASVNRNMIVNEDVTIESKAASADFNIHVSDDLYDYMLTVEDISASDIKVMFWDASLGYQCYSVIGRTIDEYSGTGVIIAEGSSAPVEVTDWMFCVNAIFYHDDSTPEVYPSTPGDSYPVAGIADQISYVTDSGGNYLRPVNVQVVTNPDFISPDDDDEVSYVYIVVEAMTTANTHQLFFTSFGIGRSSSTFLTSTAIGGLGEWAQLTFDGNNKNPKAFVDGINNLQVTWESDRTGTNQIYYGVMGDNSVSLATAAFASCVDKFAQFEEEGSDAFTYTTARPFVVNSQTYIPRHTTEEMVNGDTWNIQQIGGTVTPSVGIEYLKDLTIVANPFSESAVAAISMDIMTAEDNPSYTINNPYLQFNYQLNFKLATTITQSSDLMSSWNGVALEEKDIDKVYETWLTEFDSDNIHTIDNTPVYIKEGNKYVVGREDGIFDRFVPLVGAFETSGIDNNPSAETPFEVKILKEDTNLRDFAIGIMLEKTKFTAKNAQSMEQFLEDNPSGFYEYEETHTIYTGKARLVALVKTEDLDDRRSNYYIVREFPQVFDVSSEKAYEIVLTYRSINSEEAKSMIYDYDGDYPSRFMGMITLVVDGTPKFSNSFISHLSDAKNRFDFAFGMPHKGYYASDNMTPSKLAVFDNVEVTYEITDISVTSPTYTYNQNIVNLPDTISDMERWKVYDVTRNPSDTTFYSSSTNALFTLGYRADEQLIATDTQTGSNNYQKTYDLHGLDRIDYNLVGSDLTKLVFTETDGTVIYDSDYLSNNPTGSGSVDVSEYPSVILKIYGTFESWTYVLSFYQEFTENTFAQFPITFEGENKAPSIDTGICDDLHIVWQSNRDMYWNVYYSNSVNSLRPFRYLSQITNTTSNSIMPDVSVNRNGKRMIVWHDNREGDFGVYAARSLEGYECDYIKCRGKQADEFEEYINYCTCAIEFTASETGTHNFTVYFYDDMALTQLVKTVSTTDGDTGWFVDNEPMSDVGTYSGGVLQGYYMEAGDTATVTYVPNNNDGIFERVLYPQLIGSV